MLRRDEYFVYILLSIQILLDVDKVQFAVVGDTSYIVTDTRPLQTLAWEAAVMKALTDDSPSLFHGRTTHQCILPAYLNAVVNELCQTLLFHLYVSPAYHFCSAFFEHALFQAVTEP